MIYLSKLMTHGDLLNEFLDIQDHSGCTYLYFNAANYHLQNFNISGPGNKWLAILEECLKVAQIIADKDFRIRVMKDPDLLVAEAAKVGVKIQKRGLLLCQN